MKQLFQPIRLLLKKQVVMLGIFMAMQFSFLASAQINNTLRIIQVHTPDPSCDECGNSTNGADCEYKIEVENTTGFNSGDRVLIVQMKGASIDTDNTSPNAGNITNIGDAGNYEFFVIGRIEGKYIYPRGRLKRTYNEAGLIQLVKVASYSGDHTINTDITATAWDPSTGQGGVVAIFVDGTLTLNANINAEGKGYQGITYDVSMKGKDHNSIDPADFMVLPSTHIDVTTKGQGVVIDDTNTNGGRAPRANGGGGGIAGDTGGGGGSNYGRGGNGGNRWNEFSKAAGGIGGVSMQSYMATNRIYFGGAGGAGYVTNNNASSAAHGGGLVVIRAKKIISNNAVINASGTSPLRLIGTNPYDGGGGGGGGGSVAFEIQEFEGNLTVNVSGGNGQDLATTTYHGPGGGGGGGAFLYNLASLPTGITVNAQGGTGGEHTDGHRNGSQDGDDGGIVSYFNFVYSEEDADNDNISDACDLDTDNDGILDTDEDGQTGTDPSKDDDNDNVPNYKDADLVAADGRTFTDDNGDGINDLFDRDKDGVPDFKDLDSDNDGRPDAIEAGGTVDQSGKYGVLPDENINGLNDAVDASEGGTALILVDSDGDGSPDFVDADADNDGVNDAYESATSTIASGSDSDNDGIDDAFDADAGGAFNTLIDRDGDGFDDIFDIDSDNDGITDYYETAGIATAGLDTDADGIVDAFDVDITNGSDLNNDGIDDVSSPIDSDLDGLLDIHDLDADADGIVDNIEGQTTAGYATPSGSDTDGDGLDNAYDADNGGAYIIPSNIDGDDKPDFIDTNSDEDSESDMIEAYDINRDGLSDITPAGSDADNDGIDDAFDKTVGNNPTDGGEKPTDYPDVDDPGDDRDWRQNVPRVTIAVDTYSLKENPETATITITLSETSYQAVTIPLTYSGTATPGLGKDYTRATKLNAPSISSVVIPAGQLSGEITITTIDDLIDDSGEIIIVDMGVVVGAKIVGESSKTITIVDNDVADFTVTEISNSISETGTTATFSVVLNTAPIADVVLDLAISVDHLTEAGIDAVGNELTFKVGDWDTEQVVTVTGQNDDIIDGDQSFDIVVSVKSSADPDYSSLGSKIRHGINKDNDKAGFTITETDGSSATSEAKTTDNFEVKLNAEPTSDVVITVSVGDATEGEVDKETLTFTSGNWFEAQTVTITGKDDAIIDNTITYDITLSVDDANSDDDFDAVADQTVSVDNTDNDKAGFTITETDGSSATSEDKTTDTFEVKLDAKPSSNVVITVSVGDATEGEVDKAILTFAPGNWADAQTVTITGKDDAIIDNTITYDITLSVDDANSDDDFDAVADQTVSVDNTDNDKAGFTITETDGSSATSEDKTTDTFEVKLDAKPSSDVVITVSVGDATEGEVDKATLTFAPGNWADAQTVTITGKDDVIIDNTITYDITLSVDDANSDDDFDAVADQTVSVDNTDNDKVNSVPDASPDVAEIDEGQELHGKSLLENDSDPEGHALTINETPVVEPSNGSLTINPDGTYVYIPNPRFYGEDTFTYEVCDNGTPQACATAIVTITVNEKTDRDGDGIDNDKEGEDDIDNDGLPNDEDDDSDGDGIPDEIEGDVDTDGDGTPDYKDLDSDNDGIKDEDEGDGDTDGDGKEDFRDEDSDNDGIKDSEEGNVDTDEDGDEDYLDLDSDNDGVLDSDESQGDCDKDGIPDRIDDDLCIDSLELLEGFSPNGDGVNDTYKLPVELDKYTIDFEVFNRWGNIVYRKSHYKNDWNGISNVGFSIGDDLPVGTYYYIVKVNETGDKLQGYIYLNR